MVWVQLLTYNVFCTVAAMVVLELFAWSLRSVANSSRSVRLLTGLVLYALVVFLFVLPLFGLERMIGVYERSDELFRHVSLIGYLLSLVLAILFFKSRHLAVLKSLGYFRSRSQQ